MSALLDVSNLTYAYPGHSVLDSVQFSADGGEFVALMGVNGAGKTTLLDILAGLRPQHSGSGRQVTVPRWPRLVIPTVIIIVAVVILVSVVAGIWTDYLWFGSVGQTGVFDTTYSTKWLLFLITAIFMVVAIGANLVIAYRLRPETPPAGPESIASLP